MSTLASPSPPFSRVDMLFNPQVNPDTFSVSETAEAIIRLVALYEPNLNYSVGFKALAELFPSERLVRSPGDKDLTDNISGGVSMTGDMIRTPKHLLVPGKLNLPSGVNSPTLCTTLLGIYSTKWGMIGRYWKDWGHISLHEGQIWIVLSRGGTLLGLHEKYEWSDPSVREGRFGGEHGALVATVTERCILHLNSQEAVETMIEDFELQEEPIFRNLWKRFKLLSQLTVEKRQGLLDANQSVLEGIGSLEPRMHYV